MWTGVKGTLHLVWNRENKQLRTSETIEIDVLQNPLSLTSSPTKILPLLPNLCLAVVRRPTNRDRSKRRHLSKLSVLTIVGQVFLLSALCLGFFVLNFYSAK